MTENFEKQLNWFTKRILQIRLTEVRGFSLPIPFELSDIENNDEFSTEQSPKEHLEDLIEEIRGFYVKNSKNSVNRDDIELKYSNDNLSVKIIGIESELLQSFLTERLKTHTSLFETRAGNVLLYVGTDIGIVVNAIEQTILARLRSLKENGDVLSYGDIFEICARQKGGEEISFRNRHNDESKRNVVARDAISTLLEKIKRSTLLEHIERDQIIKNIRNEGYQLMM